MKIYFDERKYVVLKKIVINKDKCIGCFKCKNVCYSAFEVGFDGKAKVRSGISEGDIEDAIRAEISCPTGAIKVIDTPDIFDDNDDNKKGGGSSGSLLDAFMSMLDETKM